MKVYRAWMAVLWLLPGLALGQGVPATAGSGGSAGADKRPVMAVKTAAELVAAIGPDRILEVAPGTYDLGQVKRGIGDHYRWNPTIEEQYELVIRDAKNLTIRCTEKEPAHLVTPNAYANVLTFENCGQLTLENLKLGHSVSPGYCMGGVIKAEGTTGVTIRRCELYGSGIHGLELRKVRELTFEESVIRDCSYGIMTADTCKGLHFQKSRFERCGDLYGFDFTDCADLAWVDYTVSDNLMEQRNTPLFKTNLSDPAFAMHFSGGALRHNAAGASCNVAEMLVLEETKVEENAWQKSQQAKRQRGMMSDTNGAGDAYVVDFGESTWEKLSEKLSGDNHLVGRLKALNPGVKEPLFPDTKIMVPR